MATANKHVLKSLVGVDAAAATEAPPRTLETTLETSEREGAEIPAYIWMRDEDFELGEFRRKSADGGCW